MTEKEDPTFVERFTVRMPDGMRDAVAARAKANGRSMNSEIVHTLQDHLTSGIYEAIASKESLMNMPEDVRRGLIISRTAIARIKMNEALREIEENLELLGIDGDDSLGHEATNWWKSHDAKTVQTIANKKWNKKNAE